MAWGAMVDEVRELEWPEIYEINTMGSQAGIHRTISHNISHLIVSECFTHVCDICTALVSELSFRSIL